MYNSRGRLYQDQVFRQEDSQPSETQSPKHVYSRDPTPSLEPVQKKQKRETPEVPDKIPLAHTEHIVYKKAEYTGKRKLKFIEKMKWYPFPDKIVTEARNILADSYERSLASIAGSTEDNMDETLKKDLKDIARGINKTLKSTLVPGLVEENLLDPNIGNTKLQSFQEIKSKKLNMAKKLLYLEHCERILNDKKNQIQLLEEQLEKEKERQTTHTLQKTPASHDYLYSLINEPSSKIFEAIE